MPFISHFFSPSFFVPLMTSTRNLHSLFYDWSQVSKADIGFQRKISEAIIFCPHFQCRGGPRGCLKHVDSDCYDHRSPTFISSTLPHRSLEAVAFPFVFCCPYTVSTDLWETERGGEGDNSKSHFSAVKSDSCLEPVFTDSILCPEAAAIAVASIIVPSLYHHGENCHHIPRAFLRVSLDGFYTLSLSRTNNSILF